MQKKMKIVVVVAVCSVAADEQTKQNRVVDPFSVLC